MRTIDHVEDRERVSTPQQNSHAASRAVPKTVSVLSNFRVRGVLLTVSIVVVCAFVASCTVERTAESAEPPLGSSIVEDIDTPTDGADSQDDCALSTLHAGTSPDGTPFTHPGALADQHGELVIPTVEHVSRNDFNLISFDDTPIRIHWFPHPEATENEPAPTVLMGPGWSLAGDTTDTGLGLFGGVNIATLRDAGFNVLTWDPRGFGDSGGSAQVNSLEFEARDVQLALNWLSTVEEVLLDQPGDPRVGMVGVSYGGGIQLSVAIQDCRVDALVPSLAWNSLPRSLYQSELMKSGWAGVLVTTAMTGKIDQHIQNAYKEGRVSGVLSNENRDWFESRGPGELVRTISAPTLLIQGTTDTLFTLNEALVNFELLHNAGTEVAMLWFCGGHGICLTNEDDDQRISNATISWLNKHLHDRESDALDWVINIVDQNGNTFTSDSPESVKVSPRTKHVKWHDGGGTLTLQREGGSGPTRLRPPAVDVMYLLVQSITPAPADNAVKISLPINDIVMPNTETDDTLLLGTPTLEFEYRGTVDQPASSDAISERPSHIFAQLVDPETGVVIGHQVTPIPLTLDGTDRSIVIELEAIAHVVAPGDTLELQFVANTVAYAHPQITGSVDLKNVQLSIPIAEGFIPQ